MKDSTALPAPDALASAVRKARWRLLPIFVVMFIVNYVDRVNVSFIKPQLEASLGIGATAYGLGRAQQEAQGVELLRGAHEGE